MWSHLDIDSLIGFAAFQFHSIQTNTIVCNCIPKALYSKLFRLRCPHLVAMQRISTIQHSRLVKGLRGARAAQPSYISCYGVLHTTSSHSRAVPEPLRHPAVPEPFQSRYDIQPFQSRSRAVTTSSCSRAVPEPLRHPAVPEPFQSRYIADLARRLCMASATKRTTCIISKEEGNVKGRRHSRP